MNGVEYIKQLIASLDPLPDDYATMHKNSWEFNRWHLHKHLQRNRLDNFIRWSTIQATMYVGDAPYTPLMIDDLSDSPRYPAYLAACQLPDPNFGARSSVHLPDISPNLVRQAFHLLQWESHTGLRIAEMDSIVEIGGGYGDMCLLAHRLGFTGDYYLLDLPEFLILQEHYLTTFLPGADIHFGCRPDSAALQIAIYSLSEIDTPLRDDFVFDAYSYLFAYQGVWFEKSNDEYFDKLATSLPDHLWSRAIGYPSTRYLIGALP